MGEAVTAFVVARHRSRPCGVDLRRTGQEGPHQAPKRLDVVAELPTTAVGKIDKKELRARFWSRRDRLVH